MLSLSIVNCINLFGSCQLNFQFQNKTTEAEEEDPDIQWPCSWRHYLRKVIIIIDKFEGNDVKETVVNFFLENEISVETISKV